MSDKPSHYLVDHDFGLDTTDVTQQERIIRAKDADLVYECTLDFNELFKNTYLALYEKGKPQDGETGSGVPHTFGSHTFMAQMESMFSRKPSEVLAGTQFSYVETPNGNTHTIDPLAMAGPRLVALKSNPGGDMDTSENSTNLAPRARGKPIKNLDNDDVTIAIDDDYNFEIDLVKRAAGIAFLDVHDPPDRFFSNNWLAAVDAASRDQSWGLGFKLASKSKHFTDDHTHWKAIAENTGQYKDARSSAAQNAFGQLGPLTDTALNVASDSWITKLMVSMMQGKPTFVNERLGNLQRIQTTPGLVKFAAGEADPYCSIGTFGMATYDKNSGDTKDLIQMKLKAISGGTPFNVQNKQPFVLVQELGDDSTARAAYEIDGGNDGISSIAGKTSADDGQYMRYVLNSMKGFTVAADDKANVKFQFRRYYIAASELNFNQTEDDKLDYETFRRLHFRQNGLTLRVSELNATDKATIVSAWNLWYASDDTTYAENGGVDIRLEVVADSITPVTTGVGGAATINTIGADFDVHRPQYNTGTAGWVYEASSKLSAGTASAGPGSATGSDPASLSEEISITVVGKLLDIAQGLSYETFGDELTFVTGGSNEQTGNVVVGDEVTTPPCYRMALDTGDSVSMYMKLPYASDNRVLKTTSGRQLKVAERDVAVYVTFVQGDPTQASWDEESGSPA